MDKTLDPHNNEVHLVDRPRKGQHDLFHLCACGKETGLVWEKAAQDTQLTYLVCLMKERSASI